MNANDLRRKAVIIDRMQQMVIDYWEGFGKPCPMRTLSARFGKVLGPLGGFTETVNELCEDGTFDLIFHASGKRSVLPHGTTVDLVDAVRVDRY